MDAARVFARHVADTRFDDLPAPAVEAVKTFTLDSLGVAAAGAHGPFAAAWRHLLVGPPAEARVWATPDMLPATAAAALNAYQLHNSEYDCVHEGAVVHTMAVLFPAVMAFAERQGDVSGRRLVEAVAVGADVAAGLGLAARAGLRFFRPATAGVFGGTAACARLAELDEEAVARAFGIALGQVCGTMQAHSEGSPLLGMQVGFAARNAVAAVDMARAGLPGPEGSFEGEHGYLALFERDYDIKPVLASLGQNWRIAETAHKPWPSGRATHGVVEALLALRAKHGFGASDAVAVTLVVTPLVNHLVGRETGPSMAVNQARLSARWAAARILLNGGLGHEDFTPGALADAESLALAQRIRVEVDGNPDPNALTPVSVEVTLKDGRHLSRRVEAVLGGPARPLTRVQHVAKFWGNWAWAGLDPQTGEALIDSIDRLESIADISRLSALTQPGDDRNLYRAPS